jgi:hypothetical protein
MKTVPYTTSTGIKIGLRWNESPKPMAIDDKDMIRIQEAMLATPEYARSKRMYNLTTVLSTLAAALFVFGYFLFN